MDELGEMRTRVREAGTDSLVEFGNGYTHEGGLGLQQNPDELAGLVVLLKERGAIGTYLEIGIASGGTARFIHDHVGIGQLVTIDDGTHPRANEQTRNLEGIPHDRFIGDSHSKEARAFLAGIDTPDVALIDGDHTYEGVTADIALVMSRKRNGALIVLHDIVACETVGLAWKELLESGKARKVAEFVGKEKPLGIGVAEIVDPWAPVREPPPWDVEAMFTAMRGSPVSAQPHVMLATPAYNPPSLEFIHARDQVGRDLAAHAVACTSLTSPGDSLVMRGRHTLMAEFLKSNCTHLLFWDVDIEPKDPSIVRQMLMTGHDIVGGACPFRGDGGGVVCNIRQVDKDRRLIETDDVQCVEVSEIGTGFLLMSRKAIVRMCEAYPHLQYFSDLPSGYGEPMWSLFDTVIVDRRFLSEDYFFCKLWKDLGEKVYIYVPFEARHWGRKGFEASFMSAMGMRSPT